MRHGPRASRIPDGRQRVLAEYPALAMCEPSAVNRLIVAEEDGPIERRYSFPVGIYSGGEMQCADCHNRAAHSFELPDREVNRAMADGRISASLPFVKKTGVELLKATYSARTKLHKKYQTR